MTDTAASPTPVAATTRPDLSNYILDTQASAVCDWFCRDRVELSRCLLQVLLIFAILPIGSGCIWADSQPVAERAVNSLHAIPVIQSPANLKVLSGERLRIKGRWTQSNRARDESAGILWRGGMGSDSYVRKMQWGVMRDDNKPGDVRGSDVPAVDYVDLNKGTISKLTERNLSLQNSRFGEGKLLSGHVQGLLGSFGSGLSGVCGKAHLFQLAKVYPSYQPVHEQASDAQPDHPPFPDLDVAFKLLRDGLGALLCGWSGWYVLISRRIRWGLNRKILVVLFLLACLPDLAWNIHSVWRPERLHET